MRILEQHKINYRSYCYVDTGVISGINVAAVLDQDPRQVFKTLVTIANSNSNYVFLIPVDKELDLKKAARSVGEKSIRMLKSKELLPLTGYIHGGGKIGYQVETSLDQLKKVLKFTLDDIVIS